MQILLWRQEVFCHFLLVSRYFFSAESILKENTHVLYNILQTTTVDIVYYNNKENDTLRQLQNDKQEHSKHFGTQQHLKIKITLSQILRVIMIAEYLTGNCIVKSLTVCISEQI